MIKNLIKKIISFFKRHIYIRLLIEQNEMLKTAVKTYIESIKNGNTHEIFSLDDLLNTKLQSDINELCNKSFLKRDL